MPGSASCLFRARHLYRYELEFPRLQAPPDLTGQYQDTTFWFPRSGRCRGQLPGNSDLPAAQAGQPVEFTVPFHYGGVRTSA